MYERSSKMDVFRKNTNKETERKLTPEKSGSGEPCDQEAIERYILKRFYSHCRGLSANSSERYVRKGKKPKRYIDKAYDRTRARRMVRG